MAAVTPWVLKATQLPASNKKQWKFTALRVSSCQQLSAVSFSFKLRDPKCFPTRKRPLRDPTAAAFLLGKMMPTKSGCLKSGCLKSGKNGPGFVEKKHLGFQSQKHAGRSSDSSDSRNCFTQPIPFLQTFELTFSHSLRT